MRADIHDGPEHNTLQLEAGYIDARPHLPDRRKPLATHGRTIHWVSSDKTPSEHNETAIPPKLSVKADDDAEDALAHE